MVVLAPGEEWVPIEQPNWSYLVGVASSCVTRIIKNQRPELDVQIIRDGMPITSDINRNRVRVFVNRSQKFIRAPYIG